MLFVRNLSFTIDLQVFSTFLSEVGCLMHEMCKVLYSDTKSHWRSRIKATKQSWHVGSRTCDRDRPRFSKRQERLGERIGALEQSFGSSGMEAQIRDESGTVLVVSKVTHIRIDDGVVEWEWCPIFPRINGLSWNTFPEHNQICENSLQFPNTHMWQIKHGRLSHQQQAEWEFGWSFSFFNPVERFDLLQMSFWYLISGYEILKINRYTHLVVDWRLG